MCLNIISYAYLCSKRGFVTISYISCLFCILKLYADLIKIKIISIYQGYYKDTVEFYFEDRNHCKNFWKKCVEHHSFFRCLATTNREREKHRLLSKGSSFRFADSQKKQKFHRQDWGKRGFC